LNANYSHFFFYLLILVFYWICSFMIYHQYFFFFLWMLQNYYTRLLRFFLFLCFGTAWSSLLCWSATWFKEFSIVLSSFPTTCLLQPNFNFHVGLRELVLHGFDIPQKFPTSSNTLNPLNNISSIFAALCCLFSMNESTLHMNHMFSWLCYIIFLGFNLVICTRIWILHISL
jgi:hypothetical protein